MPFYHFHVRGAGLDFSDLDGAVCRDDAQAHAQALWIAREALLDAFEEGRAVHTARVEVADPAGNPLFVVPVWLSIPAEPRAALANLAAAARRSCDARKH